MSKNLNLDLETYNKNDLLQLFSITDENNKQDILINYQKKVKSLDNLKDNNLRSTLTNFFKVAFDKLHTFIVKEDDYTKYSINETQSKDPPLSSTNENDLFTINEKRETAHPTPPINNKNIISTFPIKYPKGGVNPINKKITSEILCLDSVFRNLKKYPKSNDYVYELPNPIEKVISMKLLSAEIPDIQRGFNTVSQNNVFDITMFNGYVYDPLKDPLNLIPMPKEGATLRITVPDGFPPDLVLRDSIQNQLDSRRDSFSFIQMALDEYKATFFFRFKTLIECVNWNGSYGYNDRYDPTHRFPVDNRPLTKLLRMPSYIFDGALQIGTAHDDLISLYLGTDEYPLKDKRDVSVVPEITNKQGLKYEINFNPTNLPVEESIGWLLGFRDINYNSITSDISNNYQCKTVVNNKNLYNITFYGYISADTPYGDNQDAYCFLYLEDFVGNYNDTLSVAQKRNIVTKSLFAKMQLNSSAYNIKYQESNTMSVLAKQRDYFGPVDIRKLHLKIIDKYGKELDLLGANYSLTLQFEKLYSSVYN